MVSKSATCDFVVHVGTFFFLSFWLFLLFQNSCFIFLSPLATCDPRSLTANEKFRACGSCVCCMYASITSALSTLCYPLLIHWGKEKLIYDPCSLSLFSRHEVLDPNLRSPAEESIITETGAEHGNLLWSAEWWHTTRSYSPRNRESPLKISLPLLLLPCYSYSSLATATRPSPLFLRIPSTPSKTS